MFLLERGGLAGGEGRLPKAFMLLYMQPTERHLPVERWVTPEEFDEYNQIGMEMGFTNVFSGPLVRSSYHADEQAMEAVK